MTAPVDLLPCDLTNLGDVPFGEPVEISGEDYALLMRRTGLGDGEPTVSAFNSSI